MHVFKDCKLEDNSFGAIKTSEFTPLWEELHDILETMDIPEKRQDDLRWILRNVEFRNGGHPKVERVKEILKVLIVEEEK